eukprot:TRINITY_DN309_c0_g3_i1.p2 TRINITY_DN309_c0_g3~~TRINITY_DN309_c0_g3_i1.p2  ORF type:complete len:261 (+),score=-57.99 TRINITY_DN309_c0_g3_i1:418-1200(+)
MVRSLAFGSTAKNFSRFSHSLSLRLRVLNTQPCSLQQLAGSLYKRHAVTPIYFFSVPQHFLSHIQWCSYRLQVYGFKFYFTSLTGVLFNFQSPYLFTIGRQLVLSLRRWSSLIHARFHVPYITWDYYRSVSSFAYRSFTFSGACFPSSFGQIPRFLLLVTSWCYHSIPLPRLHNAQGLTCIRFGLFPLSLAATQRVDFSFLSYGYLDVSIPRVHFFMLFYSHDDVQPSAIRLVPFGHPRIYARLTTTRGFSQPSTSFFVF